MAAGTCAMTHWLGIEIFRFGFETCTADCVGAAASDLLLAVQAAAGALRVLRRGGSGEVARVAFGWTTVNALWSATGAAMWWQPGGAREWWFEPLWRGNAQAQAALVASAWLMTRAMLLAAGWCSAATHGRLGWLAVMHGVAFGGLAALRQTCTFEHYVLFGGANLSPPLMALFCVVVALVRRHRLRWPHPLCAMCAVALPFWVGNAGVLCGRRVGPTAWLADALRAGAGDVVSATLNWDELATFHVFGAAGNELLWRAFAWLAAQEAAAARSDPRAAAAPGWLDAALKRKSE